MPPDPKPVAAALSAKDVAVEDNSFLSDLNFLKDHDSSLVVLESGHSKIIVSPKYQGKVFTSTADGDSGTSFGWVHYKAFEVAPDPHINTYGGENRVWIGPEGGKFSVFFPKDRRWFSITGKRPRPLTPSNGRLPKTTFPSPDKRNTQRIELCGNQTILCIKRKIKILDNEQIKAALGLDLHDGQKWWATPQKTC